jgi:uncharacterized phiE125 gp8 family phage protein
MVLVETNPNDYPAVTLAEAKRHLNVDIEDFDLVIQAMIVAATKYAESCAGVKFVRRNLRLQLDHLPTDTVLELPGGPLVDIDGVSIAYIDADGNSQDFDAGDYQVDYASVPGRVALRPNKAWPTVGDGYLGCFKVTYDAGLASDVTAVPSLAKMAVLLIVGHWYKNREQFTAGIVGGDVEGSVRAITTHLWPGTVYFRGMRKTVQEIHR